MIKSKTVYLAILTLFCVVSSTYSNQYIFNSTHPIFINASNHSTFLKNILDNFNIQYKEVTTVDPNLDNLHILFDIQNFDTNNLPKNYIVYQSLDLNSINLDSSLLEKLSNAIAVWDYSYKNIELYKNKLSNFHYFPQDYEYADPIILPCFLPTKALPGYKALLEYENTADSDISSHLPTLYCLSFLQNPNVILELGVSVSGQSTIAFKKCIEVCNTHIIGVDILAAAEKNYVGFEKGKFICMSDLDFGKHFAKSYSNSSTFDIIFIDTSHEYAHTMQELNIFVPLLSKNGFLAFHDSNVTPLNNGTMYIRLNKTFGHATGNTRGVTLALKEFFSIQFDEHKYSNFTFTKNNNTYHLIHYPFCNGLTIIKNI